MESASVVASRCSWATEQWSEKKHGTFYSRPLRNRLFVRLDTGRARSTAGLEGSWPISRTSPLGVAPPQMKCMFSMSVPYITQVCQCQHYQYDGLLDQWHRTGCLTDQQVWFPVDFQETFSRKSSRICSFIDIYRAGSLTPGITVILFTQAIAQLKDIYRVLIAPISINPGLVQDVLLVHCEVQEFSVSRRISRRLC